MNDPHNLNDIPTWEGATVPGHQIRKHLERLWSIIEDLERRIEELEHHDETYTSPGLFSGETATQAKEEAIASPGGAPSSPPISGTSGDQYDYWAEYDEERWQEHQEELRNMQIMTHETYRRRARE